MLLFIFEIFFYLKKKIKNKIILYTLIIAFTNSIVITANIPHAFLICVYSYIPWLLILVERIIKKQKFLYCIFFSCILFFMIIVGHFQLQFICLSFLIIFNCKSYKKNISISLFQNMFIYINCFYIITSSITSCL